MSDNIKAKESTRFSKPIQRGDHINTSSIELFPSAGDKIEILQLDANNIGNYIGTKQLVHSPLSTDRFFVEEIVTENHINYEIKLNVENHGGFIDFHSREYEDTYYNDYSSRIIDRSVSFKGYCRVVAKKNNAVVDAISGVYSTGGCRFSNYRKNVYSKSSGSRRFSIKTIDDGNAVRYSLIETTSNDTELARTSTTISGDPWSYTWTISSSEFDTLEVYPHEVQIPALCIDSNLIVGDYSDYTTIMNNDLIYDTSALKSSSVLYANKGMFHSAVAVTSGGITSAGPVVTTNGSAGEPELCFKTGTFGDRSQGNGWIVWKDSDGVEKGYIDLDVLDTDANHVGTYIDFTLPNPIVKNTLEKAGSFFSFVNTTTGAVTRGLHLFGNPIYGAKIETPTADTSPANKKYVDDRNIIQKTGMLRVSTSNGSEDLPATAPYDFFANKQIVWEYYYLSDPVHTETVADIGSANRSPTDLIDSTTIKNSYYFWDTDRYFSGTSAVNIIPYTTGASGSHLILLTYRMLVSPAVNEVKFEVTQPRKANAWIEVASKHRPIDTTPYNLNYVGSENTAQYTSDHNPYWVEGQVTIPSSCMLRIRCLTSENKLIQGLVRYGIREVNGVKTYEGPSDRPDLHIPTNMYNPNVNPSNMVNLVPSFTFITLK